MGKPQINNRQRLRGFTELENMAFFQEFFRNELHHEYLTTEEIETFKNRKIPMNNWKNQAKAHWKEFRPTMFKELQKAGRLNEALTEAVMKTHEEMNELENEGFQNHEAWEMSREKYLFLPEEKNMEEDDEVNPLAKLHNEITREMNKLMQEEDYD